MESLKIGALVSGGKDSIYALTLTLLSGKDVRCLLTLKPSQDSMMFHSPYVDKIHYFAETLDLPLLVKEVKVSKEENLEEKELEALKELLIMSKKEYGINAIITGAIKSDYQRMRINLVANDLDLRVFSPLWHKSSDLIISEESEYMDFIIVKIMAEGLNKSLIGRVIKNDLLKEILSSKLIDHAFEGGECETFTLFSPVFKKRIDFTLKDIISENSFVHFGVFDFQLSSKNI